MRRLSESTSVKGSNGLTCVTRTHVSKRGRAYKRRRYVKSTFALPSWWR